MHRCTQLLACPGHWVLFHFKVLSLTSKNDTLTHLFTLLKALVLLQNLSKEIPYEFLFSFSVLHYLCLLIFFLFKQLNTF